jgi:hypothetical protein
MAHERHLETDYLVVGAGAMGMAFVDQLIEDPDVDVVMVDRRHAAGGHWLDAYPFVRLHQPSAFYGVSSTPLGQDRVVPDGPEAGFYERAGGAEICGYYDQVMQHRLLASGQVRFHPMSESVGLRQFRSLLTGDMTEVTVRRRLVDATFMASRVPATEPPPFEVAAGARCVPIGELTTIPEPPAGYVVIGGGKTGYDACCWLLDKGTDPDTITWIRPRDAWMQNRSFTQPRGSVARAFEAVVIQLEAVAECHSVEEIFARLEEHEVMLRTDPTVEPRMMKAATLGVDELEQLRRIEDVVRLGHVIRIEPNQIVLEQGTIPTTPGHVHVHCAAPGLSDEPLRPIFTDDSITLQVVTRSSLSLSGAMIGYLETTDRSTADKNRLAPPNPWPHTPYDWLRFLLAGIATEMEWRDAPDLRAWVEASRVNLLHGLDKSDDSAVPELQGRFLQAVFPALENLKVLARDVSPAERARIFERTTDAA